MIIMHCPNLVFLKVVLYSILVKAIKVWIFYNRENRINRRVLLSGAWDKFVLLLWLIFNFLGPSFILLRLVFCYLSSNILLCVILVGIYLNLYFSTNLFFSVADIKTWSNSCSWMDCSHCWKVSPRCNPKSRIWLRLALVWTLVRSISQKLQHFPPVKLVCYVKHF